MTAVVTPAEGVELAGLAARAVAARLAGLEPDLTAPDPASLRAPGASFVTLERGGALRGCVGTLEPTRPLYRDVIGNSVRAMTDPRLPPVTADDWPELDVKVSVLGEFEQVPAESLAELVAALRPGVDGLLISQGGRRATFLPAVWDKVPDPDRFVTALLAKGGWPADRWPARLVARRYTSAEFRDSAPRGALAQTFRPGGG